MTSDIPRREWQRALDEFSLVHGGWLVSLDLLPPTEAAHRQFGNLPLLGVTTDRDEDEPIIIVSAGCGDGQDISHVIHHPTRVSLEQTTTREDVALSIASADGSTSVLKLRSPVAPDTVDGLPHGR
ncbi:MAG: DUF5335 family protein [Acidobacteria bacterium]|nr:DUF5335 family protein [Acidobacteriota bacterium]